MSRRHPDAKNLHAHATSAAHYNPEMGAVPSTFTALRDQLTRGDLDPVCIAEDYLSKANSNAGKNVYLSLDRDWTLAEAALLRQRFPDPTSRPPLYGLPISLKDCFDLAGFPTTCGSRFYAERNGIATADSWVAERLRVQGAIIVGKTHLHQLAYGITGENSDYGDCAQPLDPALLTGGSSSGAAASVQEGSAIAAIGTDTGGSIRAPAALSGLAGYRSSLGLGDWRWAAHLAPSFDTVGWLFRDLRDAPTLANALLDVPINKHDPGRRIRIGAVDADFMHDADPHVLAAFSAFLQELRGAGAELDSFDTAPWTGSFDLFAAIQASEAAIIHAGYFDHFEPSIAERLKWGASISSHELAKLHCHLDDFRKSYNHLFDHFEFLLLPCTPVSALAIGQDHSATRRKILRYTSPASLAGTPVVAIPLKGAGAQLVGPQGSDPELVAYAAYLGELRSGVPRG
jgi:aspartyl-tRNA(Asn)/glutamyl-tRNA(Gln) amidotransferase subunit A